MIKVFKFAWQMPPIETFLNNLTYPEIWSVGCQGKQCKKRVSVRKMRKQKKVFDLFYHDNPRVLDFGDCGECDRSTGVKRLHSLSPF